MKILLFMSSGFDAFSPSLHLYNALIEDLLNAGHQVHLIESHSLGLNPDIPDNLASREGFSYEVISINAPEKSQFVKRYLTGVKYCFKSIPVFIRQKGYDVMMIQSCPWAPFAVTFAKWFIGIPTIYNSQDMFPGSSIACGVMPRKWMQKIFFAMHKIAYRKADVITVISEDMKIKVQEQGVPADKIHVIVNWYDDKYVREIPWEENLFVRKYNMSKDKFYVQYAGTMGYVFDYKMVLKVAELLKDKKDIIFQMIGQGSQKDVFMNEAKEMGLDNIMFMPLEKQEMVPHVYSACSICFIPLKRGVIGNSVPSKAGLLMACRRVIVNSVDETSDYAQMFVREKIGISASNLNPEEVAAGILKMRDNPELREEYANRAKEFGIKYYSRTVNTALYEKLFTMTANNFKRSSRSAESIENSKRSNM